MRTGGCVTRPEDVDGIEIVDADVGIDPNDCLIWNPRIEETNSGQVAVDGS